MLISASEFLRVRSVRKKGPRVKKALTIDTRMEIDIEMRAKLFFLT
jgi:hypothetical protein